MFVFSFSALGEISKFRKSVDRKIPEISHSFRVIATSLHERSSDYASFLFLQLERREYLVINEDQRLAHHLRRARASDMFVLNFNSTLFGKYPHK